MQKSIEVVGQSKTDYEIFSLLADQLGFKAEFTEGRTEKQWLEHLHQRFQQAASEVVDGVPSFEEFWSNLCLVFGRH